MAVLAADMTSILAASEATGVPRSTLTYWLDRPEFVHLRQNAREGLAEEALTVARLAFQKLGEAVEAGTVEPRDLILAAGMATDKAQLLRGLATDRTEVRDITDDLGDDEKRRLAEWARGLPADTPAETEGVAQDAAVAHTGAEESATA